jgi:antitoxin (DNA-binding transcriptional repressor) of toxin-antitoxin stability system
MRVGTKELENRLSHYLRLVQQGERVEVTDRGAVVAELRALCEAEGGGEACLQALAQEGLVTVGKRRLAAFEALVPRGRKRLSEMVVEDRG